jgi:hypothetical protein
MFVMQDCSGYRDTRPSSPLSGICGGGIVATLGMGITTSLNLLTTLGVKRKDAGLSRLD